MSNGAGGTRAEPDSPRLRRPSDLAREQAEGQISPGGRVRATIGGWPPRFASSALDRRALIVMTCLSSLTPRRLMELAATEGTATRCLAAVRRGRAASRADRARSNAIDPEVVEESVRAAGAWFVSVNEEGYPNALLDLFDPPPGLFIRGSLQQEPRVAIVGARNCSPLGREVAGQLAGALARAGICVVSGGARGIDAAAHRGSLEAGGRTVAVLGSGIDVAYPKQNLKMLDEIARLGAVVSEYPPGTPAEPFRFPARNRLVAALSSAVVVVEGALGSGSMITADHGLEIGREVYAVPGSVTSELAAVPLSLIRQGAGLIRGPDDLLSDLGFQVRGPEGRSTDEDTPDAGVGGPQLALSSEERAVWDALTTLSPPDSVARSTGLSTPQVLGALLRLEMRGLVLRSAGRFERRPTGQRAG